jgi:hypothetical protein
MTTVSTSSPRDSAADPSFEREPLRCGDGDAPVLGTHLPFVAFKETNPASGAWRVRIQSRHDSTAVLYPNAIRLQARAVGAQGKSSFTWSHTTVANSGSTEKLNFLVHVNDGEPAAIEVFPATVNWNGSSQPPVKFCWPAA